MWLSKMAQLLVSWLNLVNWLLPNGQISELLPFCQFPYNYRAADKYRWVGSGICVPLSDDDTLSLVWMCVRSAVLLAMQSQREILLLDVIDEQCHCLCKTTGIYLWSPFSTITKSFFNHSQHISYHFGGAGLRWTSFISWVEHSQAYWLRVLEYLEDVLV